MLVAIVMLWHVFSALLITSVHVCNSESVIKFNNNNNQVTLRM